MKNLNERNLFLYRKYKPLFLIIPFAGISMLICLIMIGTGYVTLSINGFGVDREDRLYVGNEKYISVFENGECINKIENHTKGSYAFTIKNNTLLLSDAENIYELDLSGKELSKREDVYSSTYRQLKKIKKFVSHSGDVYRIDQKSGRKRILCNEEVIYEMPLLDLIVKLIIIANCITVLTVNILIIRIRLSKPKRRTKT